MHSLEHLIEQPEGVETLPERIRHLDELIIETDANLAAFNPVLGALLTERHRLFHLQPFDPREPEKGGSVIDPNQSMDEQLYRDPTYNIDFYETDLGLRGGGIVAFHNEKEKYNPLDGDSPELSRQKDEYRHGILVAAQQFGFIARSPSEASDPLDRKLKITDSVLVPIDGSVEAAIVPGAAGLANLLRFRDAQRNIESSALPTNRIIMTACDRPTRGDEKANLAKAGFTPGETEFEICQTAVLDLAGGYIDTPTEETFDVTLESGEYPARLVSGTVLIGNQPVRIDIISAPYDPERLLPDDSHAIRANTEETFIAAAQLLSSTRSTLVIESHDTWAPAQRVIAERIFGIQNNKKVLGTGPLKSDRIFYRDDGVVDITMAEAVVDEMTKYYKELVNLRVAADSKRTELLKQKSLQ